MNHIDIIRTDVNVQPFLEEVFSEKASSLWVSYGPLFKAFKHTETIRIIGPLESTDGGEMENSLRNSSSFVTLFADVFPNLLYWLRTNFTDIQRASLIKLFPNQNVLRHVDRGEWFSQTKRYHLCLQGMYRYEVGDEHVVVEPGTVFTFNNQIEHGAFNLKNEDRITLMFDITKTS